MLDRILKFVVISGVVGGFIVGLSLTGADKPAQKDPKSITFVYDSFIPKLLGSNVAAVTLCHTIHFRQPQALVATQTWLIAHEFIHVDQCERLGLITFYWGYHMVSWGNTIRNWSLEKGYRLNAFEQDAYRFQNVQMEPWKLEAIRLNFQGAK